MDSASHTDVCSVNQPTGKVIGNPTGNLFVGVRPNVSTKLLRVGEERHDERDFHDECF